MHCTTMTINFELIALIIILTWSYITRASTPVDERKEDQARRNSTVMLGALLGDIATIRLGLNEGGSIHAEINPYVAEAVMKWGKAYYDFPICPAVHMGFYQGMSEHISSTFLLINLGADINAYRLPLEIPSHRGYPPALLYTLGLGLQPADSSHAALLQRLYLSKPENFNLTTTNRWIEITGNPPLIHIPVYTHSFEGLYVLLHDFKLDVNTTDRSDYYGISALHVAAWLGDINVIKFLLSRGCDMFAKDSFGRLPLHYAAIRGNDGAVEAFLTRAQSMSSEFVSTLLLSKDYRNRTSLALASQPPAIHSTTALISMHMHRNNLQSTAAPGTSKIPKYAQSTFNWDEQEVIGHTNDKEIDIASPRVSTRGGWEFTSALDNEGIHRGNIGLSRRNRIDIVSAMDLTREIFMQEYFTVQRPVMITDGLADGLPLWAYWSRDDFISRYGSLLVSHGKMNYDQKQMQQIFYSQRGARMTLSAFVNLHMPAQSSVQQKQQEQQHSKPTAWTATVLNLTQQDIALLAEDIETPQLFRGICGNKDNDQFKIYLGPRSSGTPLHSHNASWNLLVTGKKKWYFIWPGVEAMHNITGFENPFTVDVKSSLQWVTDVLPLSSEVSNNKSIVHEVMQLPGDVVFIPHDWWHVTINLADSISVSQEFCSFRHSDYRIQPLGTVLYGGDDQYRGLGSFNTYHGRKPTQKVEKRQVHGIPFF